MANNADPALINTVNSLAEQRFQFEIQVNDLDAQLKVAIASLTKTHADKRAVLEQAIQTLDADLRKTIDSNRAVLF